VKKLIIIPTYNERDNIVRVINKIICENIDNLSVLVVDDNSPDGTADLVESEFNGTIEIMRRQEKNGLGKAYIDGFKWALDAGFDLIIQMDADLSHNPKYLKPMLSAIADGNDLVIGSRYIKGGGVENWGLKRRLISKFGCWYARTILGVKIFDLTGGFKCFKRNVIESIDLNAIGSAGYSFQIEMNYRAFLKKFKIKEIPIIFTDRDIGKSKMTMGIAIEAVFVVLKLKLFK
jgi:dolichol-phosphate mannosyltransferase